MVMMDPGREGLIAFAAGAGDGAVRPRVDEGPDEARGPAIRPRMPCSGSRLRDAALAGYAFVLAASGAIDSDALRASTRRWAFSRAGAAIPRPIETRSIIRG